MLSFENLLKIQVLECHDLKNLFPASVARSLSKLEYLSVFDCSALKEIVAKERFVEEEAATSSEDDIEPSFLHLSDQGSDKDCRDSSRKSDEDCGGSSRHHQIDQCSDEDSSDSS
ncbi:hypothetical protein QYF36_017474 [Acer negundo]|nr:hypothetical protein QYF36_017474 [Acer negundo]